MSGYVMPCHVDFRGMEAEEATRRLEDAMNARRLDMRVKWNEIARRADISTETLYRFRKGSRSDEATRAVEDALSWPRGTVDRILNTGEVPKLDQRELASAEPEPTGDTRAELAELRKLAEETRVRAEESIEFVDNLLNRVDRLLQTEEHRAAQ